MCLNLLLYCMTLIVQNDGKVIENRHKRAAGGWVGVTGVVRGCVCVF